MIADPDRPVDYARIKCKRCGAESIFDKSTIRSEISRLRVANFEILTCKHCNNKFSLHDFTDALESTDITIPEPASSRIISTGTQPLVYETDTATAEAFEKERLEREKQEAIFNEEKQKMQTGLPYDEKILGSIEMEEGTPKDRNCVIILKKEAELYANTFMILSYIGGLLSGIVIFIATIIGHLIVGLLNLLKRINWCIACSIARITYFLGYISLIIYSGFILFTTHRAIIQRPTVEFNFVSELGWDIVIIGIATIPLIIQLLWAVDGNSRWAKVIKKRMNEIIK